MTLWFLLVILFSLIFGVWGALAMIVLTVNAIVGAAVICALDKDDTLYHWAFDSYPFLKLQAWPIIALTHNMKPKG